MQWGDTNGTSSLNALISEPLGGAFDWRVRGVNSQGAGPWTEGSISLPAALPAKVTPFTLTRATDTNNRNNTVLSWTKPAGQVDGYQVQYVLFSAQFHRQLFRLPGDLTRWTPPYLVAQDSLVRIRAFNSAGFGPWSDALAGPQALNNPLRTPAVPALSAQAQYAQADRLPFTCNALHPSVTEDDDADGDSIHNHAGAVNCTNNARSTGLRLQIRQGSAGAWGETVDLGFPWFDYVPHVFDELTAATAYQVRCQAYNVAGSSAWSAPLSISTAPAAPVAEPSKVTQSFSLPGGLQWFGTDGTLLYWTLPSGSQPVSSWEVRFKEAVPGDWGEPISVPNPFETRLLLPNRPQPGGSHPWQVRGVNASGNGPWSDEFTFNDWIRYPLPASMTAAVQPDGRILFEWEPNRWDAESVITRIRYILDSDTGSPPLPILVADVDGDARRLRRLLGYGANAVNTGTGDRLYYTPGVQGPTATVVGDWRYIELPPRSAPAVASFDERDITTTTVTLTWSINYLWFARRVQVQLSTSSNFASTAYDEELPALPASVGVTGLRPNTRYYYRVRAWNEIGWGRWSQVDNFTTTA